MTCEEAIKYATAVVEQWKDWAQESSEQYQFYNKAIESLEKQILKKPILSADGYSDGELVYDIAECPECGYELDFEGQEHHCICGQAIDWSELK